jgi:hypothetical protein
VKKCEQFWRDVDQRVIKLQSGHPNDLQYERGVQAGLRLAARWIEENIDNKLDNDSEDFNIGSSRFQSW